MPIEFNCPACGTAILLPDDQAGLPTVCPQCGDETIALGVGAVLPEPPAPPVIPYSRQRAQPAPVLPLVKVTLLVAAILVPVMIYLAVLRHTRTGYTRTVVCAANLSGIGKGLWTYAMEGNQGMPIAAHWEEKTATGTGQVKYVSRIGSKRGAMGKPNAGESTATDDPDGRELSTTRNLWTLIRAGGATPMSFICAESADSKNDEDSPQDYWDFGVGDDLDAGPTPMNLIAQFHAQNSYGYQVPYGRFGRPDPNAANSQNLVLAADKGPYSAAAEAAAPVPPSLAGTTLTAKSKTVDWARWNSPNHSTRGRGGQNVLFLDSHVEWSGTPLAGLDDDNIYLQWSSPNADRAGRISGQAPTISAPNLTPQSNTDSFIYP